MQNVGLSGHRNGDLLNYDTPVWEVSGSGPVGSQSKYWSADL